MNEDEHSDNEDNCNYNNFSSEERERILVSGSFEEGNEDREGRKKDLFLSFSENGR